MHQLHARFLRRLVGLALVPCALLGPSEAVAAQDILIRLSVKFVLDGAGQPTPSKYGDPVEILNSVAGMNGALARIGRGYGCTVVEFADVVGYPQYFDVGNGFDAMEAEAQSNPDFHWHPGAVNIYVVNSANAAIGGDMVLLLGHLIETNWLHELGHHNGLAHTFDPTDHVADTMPQPDVNVCLESDTCSVGGDVECCCATQVALLDDAAQSGGWSQQQYDDIRFNSMSYFGATACDPPLTWDNVRLTDGQMDRFSDWSRLVHPNEATGITHFVDKAGSPFGVGLSTSPYGSVGLGVSAASSAGGDIVLVRGGTYTEALVIDEPLVLRATQGSAVIGG